jgi:hypothetical protein
MKLSDIKIGDEIVCHTPCIMDSDPEGRLPTTTVGKSYSIIEISDDSLIILNDNKEEHHFSFIGETFNDIEANYLKWFYPIERTIRKKKLEKICQLENKLM